MLLGVQHTWCSKASMACYFAEGTSQAKQAAVLSRRLMILLHMRVACHEAYQAYAQEVLEGTAVLALLLAIIGAAAAHDCFVACQLLQASLW